MTKFKKIIEIKEYKRFAEFCDACIEYKYIGICYGLTWCWEDTVFKVLQ